MSEFIDLPDEEAPEETETEPEEPELTPAGVQAEIRRTRHKKELPLYIICCVLGVISSIIIMIRSFQGEGIANELRDIIMGGGAIGDPGAAQALIFIVLTILGFVMGVGSIIALVVLMLVSLYQLYGIEMSYSVRVSETNFPERYAKVQEFSRLLGIKEPEVYVQQQNGTLNAFTAWIPGKTFIQLNAEMVDIAYMENKDFDTLFFVMAHEFGHVYLHHVQIQYMLWSTLVNFVPVVGRILLAPMLSRAREYSADRVGQALTAGKAERDCMMLLGTGRHLYKYADAEKYVNEITTRHNAIERLARWVINLLASHPIMPYRTKAILDPEKKSGKLL